MEWRDEPRAREAWKDANANQERDGDVKGGGGGKDGGKIHSEYLALLAGGWARKGPGWRGRFPAHLWALIPWRRPFLRAHPNAL